MTDGSGQGTGVKRSYRFPMKELTEAKTCAQLRGGLTYLGRLVEKQDWDGGSLAIEVAVVQPKGEEAYLEVTQEMEEGQLTLPFPTDAGKTLLSPEERAAVDEAAASEPSEDAGGNGKGEATAAEGSGAELAQAGAEQAPGEGQEQA